MDPASVKLEGMHLTAILLPSKQQTTDLVMTVRILPNDLMRLHVAEKDPLDGRVRYEATEVLMPGRSYKTYLTSRTHQRTDSFGCCSGRQSYCCGIC